MEASAWRSPTRVRGRRLRSSVRGPSTGDGGSGSSTSCRAGGGSPRREGAGSCGSSCPRRTWAGNLLRGAEMSNQLRVKTSEAGDGRVVECQGELDIATAPEVEAAVRGLLDEGAGRLRLDWSGLTFMDSTGIRLLLEI